MRRFSRFACIDWSGAATRWQPGIAIAVCARSEARPLLAAPRLEPSPGRHWTRESVLEWLLRHADHDLLIGVDFSPSLPFDLQEGFLGEGGPATAKALWREIDEACAADEHLAATSFVRRADFRRLSRVGREKGERFDSAGDPNGRRRRVEREKGSGNAASCFNLVGAKQVGRSSLTGMRVLHRLRGAIPVWPFDPPGAHGAAIVEIYTSIAACQAGRPRGRAKMDRAQLNEALRSPAIGSAVPPGDEALSDHQTDALLTAAWLRRAAEDDALWRPPPPAIADTEGWTFGVPYTKEGAQPA